MKTLYLIRHAKSSWDYPDLEDFDRPLNKRGRKDAPKMGAILREKGIKPDLILSSPALRALKTAVTIAAEVGYADHIQTNRSIYHAEASDLWEILKSAPDTVNLLFLFGHNPGFTTLANLLTDKKIDNLPTCGIFGAQWPVDSWNDIQKKKGKNVAFDYPKKF